MRRSGTPQDVTRVKWPSGLPSSGPVPHPLGRPAPARPGEDRRARRGGAGCVAKRPAATSVPDRRSPPPAVLSFGRLGVRFRPVTPSSAVRRRPARRPSTAPVAAGPLGSVSREQPGGVQPVDGAEQAHPPGLGGGRVREPGRGIPRPELAVGRPRTAAHVTSQWVGRTVQAVEVTDARREALPSLLAAPQDPASEVWPARKPDSRPRCSIYLQTRPWCKAVLEGDIGQTIYNAVGWHRPALWHDGSLGPYPQPLTPA